MARFAKGVLLAALWGALFEAAALILLQASAPHALARLARVTRVGEVAALAAAVGLLALLAGWLVARRRGAAPLRPERVASAGGLLACVWIAIGFLIAPPSPDEIQFTGDPIALRLPMVGVATLGVLACGVALRFSSGRLAAFLDALLTGRPALRAAGVAVLGAVLLLPAGAAPREQRPPDIYLISVDTLRADHLGCYGYGLPTSPTLDRLCRDSIVFENAMTLVPETIPAFTSIMTGLVPQKNRVFNNFQTASEELTILPERLVEAGYFNAAIMETSFVGTFSNLDQGFDLVVQRGVVARSPFFSLAEAVYSLWAGGNSIVNERFRIAASATTGATARWLRELPEAQPLFVSIWWPYPHDSYAPPDRYLELVPPPDTPEFVDEIHAYDGEIRFTDDQVEGVLRAIDRYRNLEESWIVFTADHGEELGREVADLDYPFFGHSHYLYDASLRIPMIVHPPRSLGLPARRDPSVVNSASLAATLLRAAGLDAPPGLEPALALAPGSGGGDRAFAVMRRNRATLYGAPLDRVSVRSEQWRLVETRRPTYRIELLRYGEQGEVPVPLEAHPEVVDELMRELHAQYPPGASGADGEGRELTPAEEDLLRSLGYLD